MRRSCWTAVFLCVALATTVVVGCGGSPAPSGRYSMTFEGDTLALDFKDGDKVISSMTEDGQTESMDCTYQVKGENVTVRCPGGDPMRLTFKDGSLEADMNGVILRLNKR